MTGKGVWKEVPIDSESKEAKAKDAKAVE